MTNETTGWSVGYNMPGYLPEAEPYITSSWENARQALIDELVLAEEEAHEAGRTVDAMAAHSAIRLAVRSAGGQDLLFYVGEYAYWLTCEHRDWPERVYNALEDVFGHE